jgi:hypothetical protein
MHTYFRTQSGRLALLLGGADLLLMGAASLLENPQITAHLLAVIPMLSIAVGINVVVLATHEKGGTLPVSILSLMLFLAGVYVYGLASATFAGPAVGVLLIVLGASAALYGLLPNRAPTEHRTAEGVA